MLATIERLEEQTVTEVFEDWSVTYRIIPIIAGVEVNVYDESGQAVLVFNGGVEIEFAWTDEAAAMFENIDVADPVELLELLARLNRKIESDMQAKREARQAWQDANQPDWDCLTLEREPALEKSLDGMVYRTMATCEDGNRFMVTWKPDADGICDWDNPTDVKWM